MLKEFKKSSMFDWNEHCFDGEKPKMVVICLNAKEHIDKVLKLLAPSVADSNIRVRNECSGMRIDRMWLNMMIDTQYKGSTIFVVTCNTDLLSNDIMRPDCYGTYDPRSDSIYPIYKSTLQLLRKAHNLEKLFRGNAFVIGKLWDTEEERMRIITGDVSE